jgi:hypothetical protein
MGVETIANFRLVVRCHASLTLRSLPDHPQLPPRTITNPIHGSLVVPRQNKTTPTMNETPKTMDTPSDQRHADFRMSELNRTLFDAINPTAATVAIRRLIGRCWCVSASVIRHCGSGGHSGEVRGEAESFLGARRPATGVVGYGDCEGAPQVGNDLHACRMDGWL